LRFKLYAELPSQPADLKRHVAALGAMASSERHAKLFDHLYGCLSILDAKSTSLLTFDAVIIAVFAVFMAGELPLISWVIVDLGTVTILVSCFFLLSVVWVHWSTTDHLADFEQHALTLLEVRRARTIKYRLAWYLSVSALIMLALHLILRLVYRLS
jgi:hypothetical protein